MERQMKWYVSAAVIALVFFSGCAEKGPIFLEIPYQPPAAKPAAAPKIVVGLSPFKDERGKPSSVLGKSTYESGVENDLDVMGTVSELVAARLKDAFQARGITVKDVAWDMKPGDINAGGADILIGGEIKSLSVNSVSKPFKTTVTAVIQMKVVAADAAEKKIIRELEVNSKLENEIWPYSPQKIEDTLSGALSAAIDQIFSDEVLKKKFQ